MKQKSRSDSQSGEEEIDINTQLENLSEYAHMEINNLYSLIDGLDKKVLHIEIQENYQSQYSINERLDKLERREMQEPLSYDDVLDIKKQLKELKEAIQMRNLQSVKDDKFGKEMASKSSDASSDDQNTDIKSLQSDVNTPKSHTSSYAAPTKNDDIKKDNQKKSDKKSRKPSIPIPPSERNQNSDSNKNCSAPVNSDDLIERVDKKEKVTNDLSSKTKTALNNSSNAKLQASEVSAAASKAEDKAKESDSKVDEYESRDKKVDSKIRHIKSKVKKLSKKVDDLETSEQPNNNDGDVDDVDKKKDKSEKSEIGTKSEKREVSVKSKSTKSEKKDKSKLGKHKSLKLKLPKKKDKKENEAKKKTVKDHKSEKSEN